MFVTRKKEGLVTLLLFVFTFLVGNAAGSLAGGLAGCLAFAATAVIGAVFQISGFYGFDSFHGVSPLLEYVVQFTVKGAFCQPMGRWKENA